MSDDLTLRLEIQGRDEASKFVKAVEQALAAMARQAEETGKALKASLGGNISERFAALKTEAEAFGKAMAESGEIAAKALRSDLTAAVELKEALHSVVAEQKALGTTAKATRAASASTGAREVRGIRTAATARATAATDDLRSVRSRWAVRERSEAAELNHVKRLGREQRALRRDAMLSAREVGRYGYHAMRSANHPVHESIGFALTAGAAAGGAFAEHIVRASEAFDTSMSRLRMFAPQLDADAIRKTSLRDSVDLGVDASKIVDMIAKSVRDGVPPEIAKSLPKSIAQTAQVMGGDIERLTDSLAEGIQESTAMGWIKNQSDARRFLNLEAGLSTTAGNTSEKTEQFISAGGLGHGKEMGLDLEKTMAFGAMLNASGARTGQASARFMGQLSQNIPKMFDKWMGSVESGKSTEESRAVTSAPLKLGYGGIRQMQSSIMAGPEGLIDFAARLQTLDDKARKLVLEGYGFSEQGGAMLAELGSGGGAKGKAVLARAKELAEQKEANDYLSEKFGEWSKSLSFMIQQIEAGWRAIENEVGDTIKTDIIAPLRDWWVLVSSAIVNSDLKGKVHLAIMDFVHGLGFDDVRALLDTMTASVHGFDFAGFAKGIGEGIAALVDDLKRLGSVFGGGGLSAETVGRLATEFLGLSLALRFVAPAITIIGGIASAFLAIKAAVEGIAIVARLTGIADGIRAIVGVETAATATGLLSVAGGLTAIGVAIQALMSAGVLQHFTMPWANTDHPVEKFLWGTNPDGTSARPAWTGGPSGSASPGLPGGAPNPTAESPSSYWAKKNAFLKKSSFEGGDGENWRDLMTPASYQPSDSGEVVRDAILGTEKGVVSVRDAIDRLGDALKYSALSGANDNGASGFGSDAGRPNIRFGHQGGTGGGGTSNMRYGHSGGGGHGQYRSTPGSGDAHEIGPRVSLGKMGGKFAAKAPVIMDGLMKKYGLTREQAAGVLGNLGHESAGFTAYHEGGQASSQGGVGWAQWTGPRRRAFEKWTAAHNLNPTSDEASWRYLTEGDPETAGAIAAVKGTNNRRDATRAFHDKFERSADISHGVIVKQKSWNSRLNYADKAFAGTPGGATVATDKPLGTPSNPVTVQVDPKSTKGAPQSPADIASQVPTHARPRPGGYGSPAGSMISASAGDDAKPMQGGHHFEMHFHSQVADAQEHANHVGRAVDEVLRNRSHDVDYQAA